MEERFEVISSLGDFKWKGVPTKVYKTDSTGFKDIIRREIIGKEQDSPVEIRYFEIGKGGYSSLEEHRHIHAVIIVRGRGRALIGSRAYNLKPFDAVYVGPRTAHQFHQVGDEPFGFLCVVSAKRDRPRLVSSEKAERLKRSRRLRGVVKT
jgi:quercetin dioxygenase-like cupin family protein